MPSQEQAAFWWFGNPKKTLGKLFG